MIESKRKEILNLKAQEKSCENQIKELDAFLLPEIENLKKGYNLPIPKGFQPTSEELIERWDEVSCEWQKRCQESEKTKAVFNSIAPRIKELQNYKAELKEELKKEELVAKRVTCAKKVVNFLDYKHAPRKLLEGVVTNLFDLTNRLGESLNVDIKLKLGKNLEFLTLQSRAGRWIEQKTERLGFGKGAILGICFRLACQRLLLPETGFLILDEPTANVDLKRKGLFKLFLQNLSEDSHIGTKARTSQIILIEHDEDVVELCQTKIDIKDKTA
jgi:DNA repair exonuclease SbcCD ATPase subunit